MVAVPDQALVQVVVVREQELVAREPGLEQALVPEPVPGQEKGKDREKGKAQEKGMAQGMGQEPALDCRRHRCGQSEWQHQSPPR